MTGTGSSSEKSSGVWDAASRGDHALIAAWCAQLRSLHCGGLRHTMVRAVGLPRRRAVARTKAKAGGTRAALRARSGDVVSVAEWPRHVDCCDVWTGWTPLMLAVANNHKYVVHLLLAAGASPVATSEEATGGTALHVACRHGRLGIMKSLMGVSPKGAYVMDNRRQTCLHAACATNRVGILRWVLDQDKSEDHGLVSVIGDDEMFEEAVTDTLEAHRKTHKDLAFMIRAKKMRASLGF
jgi:hypothetical protein